MAKHNFWLGISVLTIVVCAVLIVFVRPIWGIDFTGGSLIELQLTERGNLEDIRSWLSVNFKDEASVQVVGEGRVVIKTAPLSEQDHAMLSAGLADAELVSEELRFESIGPTIGEELRSKAVTAIVVVVGALIAYLAYTFRQARDMMQPWKFGMAAVYALVHDMLVVMALFVILGKTNSVAIDSLFVTAMLAILGYSVNDTIVIFNRMKTEYFRSRKRSVAQLLNQAVASSLIRSLNTSLTTLLVLLALLLLGGASIRWFVVALMVGTIVGTYSSLLVAPPMLIYLSQGKLRWNSKR